MKYVCDEEAKVIGSRRTESLVTLIERLAYAHWRKGLAIAAITVITAAVVVSAHQNQDKIIALSSIITTSPQAKMRYFSDIFSTTKIGNYTERFGSFTTNASNVFLVEATNEHDAIIAGASVFFGPFSADTPATANTPNPKGGSYWLVSYLGAGPSDPTSFVVESVSIAGEKIRLTYSKTKATDATRDVRLYYFWVPLGKLRAGNYYVELFDSSRRATTLLRRVEVEQEKRR